MKIAFLYGKQPSSTLTLLATGSTCYHVGFTDEYHFWDMNLLRRRRLWEGLYPQKSTIVAESPVKVTSEFLNLKLDTDNSRYGILDYILFALRPIYHLFGKSTRNMRGIICSEMVANDMIENGWKARFKEVPSPSDLEEAILGKRDAIKS